jgi:hypothetical protein
VLLLPVFGGLIALAVLPGQAQESPKQKPDKSIIADGDLDVPPDGSDADTYRLVELRKDDPVFKQVVDNQPLATSKSRPGEFKAFATVVKHTTRVPQAAIERHVNPGMRYEALAEGAARAERRPIRIDGTLVRLKAVEPDSMLRSQTGVKQLYEGTVQVGGQADQPAVVIFTEKPADLEVGRGLREHVIFDGYYFKLVPAAVSNDDGQLTSQPAPLLVGRSITVTEPDPLSAGTVDEAAQVRLAKGDQVFRGVRDKTPLRGWSNDPDADNSEYTAYGMVFLHTRKFSPEQLARHSRRDVVYRDLIEDTRVEFLRELLHVEGRLVRLRKREAPPRLRSTSEIQEVYEGWVYHENEPNPIVITFTELPPGIEPGESLSYRVAFDGYYFKLYAYESKEVNEKGKPVWRVAPLLIGRKLQLLEDAPPSTAFVTTVLIVVSVIFATAVGLTLWFRRGDRRVRSHMESTMAKENPFEAAPVTATPPPPIRPGDAWNRLNEPPPTN